MATISNVNGKKITKIKYKGEIYDAGGGGSGATSTLKTLLDATKSTYNLFYQYSGISVNDLISYNDTENVIKMENMFSGCSNLTTIPQLNTSNVTTMFGMFQNCSKLTTIPQLDTSNVTTMASMFSGCRSLTTIPQMNTSKVETMSSMFNGCSELTIVKLDTSKVSDMQQMFYSCRKLITIDITYMKINYINQSASFASGCYSLTKLIIRNMSYIPELYSNAFKNCYHFTGTTNETYNPQGLKDGRIYVPDDKVEALKTATNWSVYADIIVPLSTLVE